MLPDRLLAALSGNTYTTADTGWEFMNVFAYRAKIKRTYAMVLECDGQRAQEVDATFNFFKDWCFDDFESHFGMWRAPDDVMLTRDDEERRNDGKNGTEIELACILNECMMSEACIVYQPWTAIKSIPTIRVKLFIFLLCPPATA